MSSPELNYRVLNTKLNLYDMGGRIQFDADHEVARQCFLQHINQNMVFFHDLEEEPEYLIEGGYYEGHILNKYPPEPAKSAFKAAHAHKFRFETFLGTFKYYASYMLKTFDGKHYLKRSKDRVATVALILADGDEQLALDLVDEMMSGRLQSAIPAFLNEGEVQCREPVSCPLVRTEDNMESIARGINSALQLPKRGGGVVLLLSNLRKMDAPIEHIENQSSSVIPVTKLLEDSFSYANQPEAYQGAGAVHLHVHHPDTIRFLDTKRENADEKIRIKTFSLGIAIPDITFELARNNEGMYLFSPYDVERVYGMPFADTNITEKCREMVDDGRIKKKKINARTFFQALAEIQFESDYPYVMFEDTVSKVNPIKGRIVVSNLCFETLQVSELSKPNRDLTYIHVGKDISCNLGSLNITRAMDSPDFANTIRTAVRGLTAVSNQTHLLSVPSIDRGNYESHTIGLGQISLHGFLARERIHCGSEESLDLINVYFTSVLFATLTTLNGVVVEHGENLVGFEDSAHASGKFSEEYVTQDFVPITGHVKEIFVVSSVHVPIREDRTESAEKVKKGGLYNRNLQTVSPTGSISYINNSAFSIHPIMAKAGIRKEGKIDRVYYPAPFMMNDNLECYRDAYEIGPEETTDTYAMATQYIDQGLGSALFSPDTATTRDVSRAQIYTWHRGIRTLYYIHLRQAALTKTEVEGCVFCIL